MRGTVFAVLLGLLTAVTAFAQDSTRVRHGGEADVTPYALSRYFGLRSFSVLYGFTWTFYAVAGALGPVLMGRAFDLTGSYQTFLLQVAGGTLAVAALMLCLPRYATPDRQLTPPTGVDARGRRGLTG